MTAIRETVIVTLPGVRDYPCPDRTRIGRNARGRDCPTRRGVGVKEAAMIRWLPLLATAALLAAGCAQQVVRPTVDPFLGDVPRDAPKEPDKEFVGRAPDPPVGTPAGT